MDPSTRMVGLDAQGNMVFTVVKPVMGIFQVSSEQTGSVAQGGIGLQGLSENTLILPQTHGQAPLEQNQVEMHTVQPHIQAQMQVSAPAFVICNNVLVSLSIFEFPNQTSSN